MHSKSGGDDAALPHAGAGNQFRVGVQSFLAGLFPAAMRREDVRDLTPYLKRDIGLEEQRVPDWERLLR